jgi:DNA gyrase subunit A
MAELAKEVIRVNIEDEMRQSYLDYAMSVIVGRALPDVRDGLKPVHRRVLFGMYEANNVWNRAYVKCARIVGDVMGKFHPHGDSSIYDALVRMAQDFSLRYPLVDGQGNFGSVDGDNAAAMRYTECRLERLSSDLLADIDKETVDFQPNYDEKEFEPSVLPTRVPNLLVNGSAGIAVGMATNVPPHNLGEIVDATIAVIDNPEISFEELLHLVPGPDFPTHGIINGAAGIVEAYRTGRGRIYVRAKADIETDDNGRETIIVTELPYQVNKKRLIEAIAELHKEKKIEGISELRDESDKDGLRIVFEVRKDTMADVLLNNLYQQTQMQVTFGINMVALVDGQPQLLTLKQILEAFVRHRREVVTRRTLFELREARKRAHVLEGLTVALANIDEMIELIKTSESGEVAKERMLAKRWDAGLVRTLLAAAGADASKPEDLPAGVGLSAAGYQLSEIQAQQILDMRLAKLTGLEQEKLTDEYKELLGTIQGLLAILMDADKLLAVIREELAQIKAQYGDARRTVIQASQEDLDVLDLIAAEDVVVTLSHAGYAKRQPVTIYRAQRRGGKGRSATNMKEEDFVERLWIANTHDTLLAFTSAGRVLWLKVHQIPDAGPGARGKPIVNLLPLEEGEAVQAVLPVREFPDNRYVFFATRKGTVKKTPLSDYSRPRSTGIRAIDIEDGDGLVDVSITDGARDIFLFASNGKAVRFAEDEVRPMGRTAHGVRGIQCSDRNGALVGAVQLDDAHELMLISNQGTLVRTRAAEVARVGRNTQGVTLIRLPQEEALVGVVRVEALNGEDEGDADADEAPQPTV